MSMPSIIAIDGPAASGKSTLGLKLAEKLAYLHFDTGVMYRAVAWIAIQAGASLDDEEDITRLAEQVPIDVRPPSKDDGRSADVIVGGQDATWEIRKPEVDATVSTVAAYRGVRRALTAQQRRIGLRGKVVMVGRDIGTVVLPEADLKVYLDASVEERARRRYLENQGRQETASYDAILQSMRRRDRLDSTRKIAPLRPAEDAVIINSNRKDAQQILEEVLALCNQWNE